MNEFMLKVELNGICGSNKSCSQVTEVNINQEIEGLAFLTCDLMLRLIQQGWAIPQSVVLKLRDKVIRVKVTKVYKEVLEYRDSWGSMKVYIKEV